MTKTQQKNLDLILKFTDINMEYGKDHGVTLILKYYNNERVIECPMYIRNEVFNNIGDVLPFVIKMSMEFGRELGKDEMQASLKDLLGIKNY